MQRNSIDSSYLSKLVQNLSNLNQEIWPNSIRNVLSSVSKLTQEKKYIEASQLIFAVNI